MIPRRVLDICPLGHKYTGKETESNTCGGTPCTDCPDIDWDKIPVVEGIHIIGYKEYIK